MVGDPNSTREAAAFTRSWIELGEAAGCTVCFLHHTKKPIGDQRDVDPFDQIRGSSDFGAAARNIIVSRPLPHDTEKIAEVRMRGNLDLRTESFVLGFHRELGPLGRYQAKLTDRGEVAEVKDQVKKQRTDDKETKKRQALEETYQQRKNLALELAHKEGFVTQKRLAFAVGLSSERSLAGVFERMVAEKLLEKAGKHGYVIAGATHQEGLL
jgi:RecA-family ATPase